MKSLLKPIEKQYLRILDRRDIRLRIPFKEKRPHILNWTKYYSEPLTISQLLEQGFNYGIRTGKQIGNYYFIVIDLDDYWAKARMRVNLYVQSNKGLHYYLLIKELPKNSYLYNQYGKKIGDLLSLGKQVVGIGSIHPSGKRYSLFRGNDVNWSSLKMESLTELEEFLLVRDIFLKIEDKKV